MKPFLIGLCIMGRVETARRCLEALLKNTTNDLYDLVIVSQDARHEAIDTVISTVNRDYEMVLNEWNTGIIFGHNQAIAKRQPGQHYIKIDDDCLIETPGWLEQFLEVLKEPTVGSVLGRRPTFWIDAPGRKNYFHEYVTPVEINNIWVEQIDYGGCVGCWWCLKGDVLDYIGPFNEATSNDDMDWNVRALALGYHTCYIPDVVIKQTQEEPIIHPQSLAQKVKVQLSQGLHQVYLNQYKRGKVCLGSRFTEFKNCEELYIQNSNKNWEWFKHFNNSSVEGMI